MRIAIWGINEDIIKVIRNEINPLKATIVCFIDSSKERQKELYMGKSVISPEEFNHQEVDYIIVAALSAYPQIKVYLSEKGVPLQKIHPFITPQLTSYCLGELGRAEIELLKKIYFEPNFLKKEIQKYIEAYEEYITVQPYRELGDEWFLKSQLISHACGGIVNGKQCMYSNSKEALEYSFEQGFPLIECDILGLEMGEPVLAHDFHNLYEAEEKGYTLLTIKDVLTQIQKHPEVSLLIDVKWRKSEEYAEYVNYIENTIQQFDLSDVEKTTLKKQIVMEVYNEETIKAAYDLGFEMFFTQYRNEEKACYMKIANLCCKYGIGVVGFGTNYFEDDKIIAKFLPILKHKNIKVFCFSTDSLNFFKYLQSVGVDGVFTNYLTIDDVNQGTSISSLRHRRTTRRL